VNVYVSGPVRVFALVGGLAALALGAWFFLLGGMSQSAATEPVKEIKPLYGGKQTPTAPTARPKPMPKPAVKTQAAATKPGTTKTQAQATPKPKPAPKPKVKPTPKPVALANPEKLPLPVARALARYPVVVVALYSPEAKVDRISLGEARAGAERARVGFVALNALDRRASEALMR
jgi:outer membrane biosynthesis protein TonB